MNNLCGVLKSRMLFICIAISSLSAGCRPQVEVPVWLDDSSGVVVGEEFLQIQNGAVKVTKLTSPAIIEIGIEKAHPKTRQMASFHVQVNGTSKSPTLPLPYFNGRAEVKLCIRSLATPDVADVQESLTFDWKGNPDCPLDQQPLAEYPISDLYWSPDGVHLILSLGARTVLFDVTNRKWLQLPDVIVLPYFEQLYGVSPCCPDNAGFLGWRMKARMQDSAVKPGTQTANSVSDFWSLFAPVFVTWSGSVRDIAVPGSISDAGWLISTEWRFPGKCRWKEKCLLFSSGNESLTIDSDACEIRLQILDEPEMPHRKSGDVIDRAVMNGGRTEIQLVLTKDINDATVRSPPVTGQGSLCVMLQVVDQLTGTPKPIDLGAWSQFQLIRSPDRNYVLVTNCASGHKPGPSLLFDANGTILWRFDYHAEYPWDFPDLWFWEVANRFFGVPVHFHEPFVPPDREYEVETLSDDGRAFSGNATDATLEFMANVTGPVATARQIKGLDIEATQGRLTRDGLRHLHAFSELRYLRISGITIEDSDLRHFRELKRLEKLVFAKSVCTDEAIAALKQHLPNTEILYKTPASNRTSP
jgi:hypothetical protein